MRHKSMLALSPLLFIAGCPGQCQNVSVPSPTKPPMLAAPAEVDDEVCRIPQAGRDPGTYSGEYSTAFPFERDNIQPDQSVSLLVLPVDWVDHRGTARNLEREFEQVEIFTDLYTTMSEGRLTFTTTFGTRWYRLPEPIANYPQDWSSYFNTKLAQHAVDAVDPEVDFSTVDIVILVFPDNPPIPILNLPQYGFASMQHFNRWAAGDPRNVFSDEGWVRNYVGGAGFFDHPLRPVWSYYAHEIGHTLRLPDWYLPETSIGSSYQPGLSYGVGPMGTWDLMSTQDGPSRTFSAWTRWLLGWLSDDQVACFTAEQIGQHGAFDVELVPLDVYEPGVKAVMIRTGPNEGLVLESRRAVFPDHDLVYWNKVGRTPAGLLVYHVDATKGHSAGTLSVLPPRGQGIAQLQLTDRMDPRLIDGLYNLGAIGDAEGLTFELIYSGDRDIVRISSSGQ